MAYSYSLTRYLRAGALLLAACGGGGGDGSTESAPCGDPSRWSTELIPAEKAASASYVFAAGGVLQVVYRWYIPGGTGEEAEYGEDRRVWLHRAGGAWISERITPDGHDNVVGSSLAVAGGRPHVIWRHDYNNSSVHYRQLEGDTWSPRVDLLEAVETVPLASAFLVGQGDKLALVYNTSEAGSIRSDTLRVRLAWIEGGTLASEPVTILEGDRGCLAGNAEIDQAGTLHVLAGCRTSDHEGSVRHVTVADASIEAEVVGSYGWGGLRRYNPTLSMAATPDGTLHVLWRTHGEDGEEVPLHARRVNGQWTSPVQPPDLGRPASLRVASSGDVILVSIDVDDSTKRTRFQVWSDEGGFAPDCERLPDLEGPSASNFSVDPETGGLIAVHDADVDDHLALSSLGE